MDVDPWIPGPLGIFQLHGAALSLDGKAVLVLGPSGAGKSTLCRLLSPYLELLAEDRIFVIPQDSGWRIADATNRYISLRLTSAEASALAGKPLHTILRVFQDSVARSEPLFAIDTCRVLTDAFFQVRPQVASNLETKKAVFSWLAEISRTVPGYRIYSDKTSQAAELVWKLISQNEKEEVLLL